VILEGDCVEAMRGMDEASVDAICTDPPYELGFMSKAWDRTGIAYQKSTWTEALRVLKPGGHLLAFGGTRTHHRLACAIEDAGFEIRDCLVWMYGSGFPKSLDVSKAIDKAAGAEREVVSETLKREQRNQSGIVGTLIDEPRFDRVTRPATPEAARWQGWGTALKPAHEPIVLARKPLTGTVAQNCLTHGTGALNVDGCRVDWADGDKSAERKAKGYSEAAKKALGGVVASESDTGFTGEVEGSDATAGRWPANVALDPEAAAMLDEQSGERVSGSGNKNTANRDNGQTIGHGLGAGEGEGIGGDTGGASRFFYCAKASRAERSVGLPDGQRSSHPTVKPISLMRWLCRLVTPPGGTILDPFTGSGTTGCAAVLEGFDFIGIEREPEYVAIAEARIAWWAEHRGREADEVLADSRKSEAVREKHEGAGQLGMFEAEVVVPSPRVGNGRDGEPSAERTYADRGASNFAMKPGRRRAA
jgi:DNA modification methylase